MRRNYEQMTLGDIYSDIAYCFEEEKPRFFRLMNYVKIKGTAISEGMLRRDCKELAD
jgi:hypothetical protein